MTTRPPTVKTALAGHTQPTRSTQSRRGHWLGCVLALGWLGATAPTALAQADPPGCLGSGLGIALYVDKSQARVGDQLQYSVLVYNSPFPACKASEIIAWIVTPDGVTNSIPLRRNTLRPGESDSYSNVATYLVRSEDLQQGIVIARAFNSGKIHQSDVLSDGTAMQSVNTLIVTPCISITAECSDTSGDAGRIGFTGTVTNCGDLDLTEVTVTNVVAGVPRRVFGPVNLATKQTVTFSGSYLPPDPCAPSTAQFVASGVDRLSPARRVTDMVSTTCAVALNPGLALGQSCPPVPVVGGALLTYTGSVTNTGNVTLTDVVILSDQPAPNTVVRALPSLAPGEVSLFTASFRAPTGQCSVTITLQATATTVCGLLLSEQSARTCALQTRPALTVTQACPSQPVGPGETLTFTGTVRNTGDVALTNIEVFSSRPAPRTPVFSAARLEPGVQIEFSGSYTAPPESCGVSNTLTAEGRDACSGNLVSHQATTVCALTPSPALEIVQGCPENPPALGGVLTYTATVVNRGNITVTNLVVYSDRPGPNSLVFRAASLPAGAATNFTASYSVPADLNSCSISSTLRVVARARCTGQEVRAQTTTVCAVRTAPGLRISTTCPPAAVRPGDPLVYSGTIQNTGDITLTNVVVLSSQPAPDTEVFRVASLPPAATLSFSGSFPTPLDSCAATWTLAVAGADGCTGDRVTHTASATCPLQVTPNLAVGRNCPPQPVVPGQQLTFTGTITNTGNITLRNVRVVNSLPVPGTPVFGPADLPPGAGATFTGSYPVPVDLDACEIVSTLTATAENPCDPTTVTTSAVTRCPVLAPAGVRLTVQCPDDPSPQGGTLRFRGSLENTGDITLTDLVVVNNRPVPDTVVLRVASLPPGAITNFTGTFTVPTDCCSVVSTLSVTGADRCGTTGVWDTATMVCAVQFQPALRLTAECPAVPVAPGQALRYTGHLENAGTITLVNVLVYDEIQGPEAPWLGPIDLAPGERVPYTGRRAVPLDTCGVVSAQIVATGEPACGGNTVAHSVALACPIQVTPELGVFNERLPDLVPIGVPTTGHGSVANLGNVSLTNVVVTCNLSPSGNPVFGPITLAPGQSASFDYTFQVPDDCDCCQVIVTLTAQAQDRCQGLRVTNTATALMNCRTSPRLSLGLDCQAVGVPYLAGEVRNTGDITLTNVVVLDRLSAIPLTLAGPFILAPGESKYFYIDDHQHLFQSDAATEIQAQGTGICGGTPATAVAYCGATAPQPGFVEIHASGTEVLLHWAATPEQEYRVQYRASLDEGAWRDLQEDVLAIGSTAAQVDAITGSARFYRVIRVSP